MIAHPALSKLLAAAVFCVQREEKRKRVDRGRFCVVATCATGGISLNFWRGFLFSARSVLTSSPQIAFDPSEDCQNNYASAAGFICFASPATCVLAQSADSLGFRFFAYLPVILSFLN